ncbi:MAG: hypothetical protein KDD70_03585 [Bdellovibrionales bacterium]|nr:hypothetical protein [Bdellovibrionales bacterium]
MSQLLTKNTLLAAMQRQVAEAADREHPSGDLPIELEDALTDLHNLTAGSSSPSIDIDIAQSSKELSRTLRKLEEHPRGVRFEQLLEGAIALQMLHDSATDGALERSPKFRETKAILALSERLGELGGNGAKVLENRLLNAIEGLSRCSWSMEPDSEFREFISNLDTPTAFGQTLKAMGNRWTPTYNSKLSDASPRSCGIWMTLILERITAHFEKLLSQY